MSAIFTDKMPYVLVAYINDSENHPHLPALAAVVSMKKEIEIICTVNWLYHKPS